MQEHEQIRIDNAYYGFWSTVGLGVLIFLLFSIIQSIFLIFYVLYQQDLAIDNLSASILDVGLSGNAIAVAEIPSALVGTLLVIFFASRKKVLTAKQYLQSHLPSFSVLLKWLGVMVLVILALEALNVVFEREIPDFMTQVFENTDSVILLWIAVVIGAPVFEEFLFRGFIFEGLLHSKVGLIGAILIPASTWAIIHMQYGWFEIATIFLIGIVLGIAKYKTKSLYIPIAMHMLMNLTASVMMELTQ